MPTTPLPAPTYLREVRITFKKARPRKSAPVGQAVGGSGDVYALFRHLQHEQKEHFLTLHLDARHRIICYELVAVGSLQAVYMRPMEIFRSSFLLNAHAAIVLHNHPSGDPRPSKHDKRVTRHLRFLADTMGLQLLDHLIIGEDSYFSFKDEGLLE